MKNMNKKQLIVVALAFTLLLLIGGTYAYFSINATSDKTGAKVTGKANNLGNPTMQIKTSKLYLNLDANLMSQANAGKTYYANENESGLALTTNPNYVLAVAQLPESDEALDCTYNYKVTATVTTPITDNSDNDVKVVVGDKTMTLKELTTAGTTGIIVSGEIKNLTKGQSVSIPLTSSVTNTSSTQDKLVGNSYTIKIEPYNSGNKKAFSCKLRYKIDKTKTLAQNLVDSGWLWQSGLEGDGYRYVGTGEYQCSYNNGKYITTSGANGCPSWTYDENSKKVTLDSNSQAKLSTSPNNFICFGTTDKTECTANQDKYMYRVIGVFSDAYGKNHVKLIKYKQLIETQWNLDDVDVNWGNGTLNASLNDSGFLTNTTYIPSSWSNKIERWEWIAVNTKSYENDGNNSNTFYFLSSPKGIYLNEMHKTSTGTLCTNTIGNAVNCNGGSWTNFTDKISLMYASDYALSLGSSALALTPTLEEAGTNFDLLKTGWMHQSNNDTTKSTSEWTIASDRNPSDEDFKAYYVDECGGIGTNNIVYYNAVRPVFYLTSDVKITLDGDGSLENPFIISE